MSAAPAAAAGTGLAEDEREEEEEERGDDVLSVTLPSNMGVFSLGSLPITHRQTCTK